MNILLEVGMLIKKYRALKNELDGLIGASSMIFDIIIKDLEDIEEFLEKERI